LLSVYSRRSHLISTATVFVTRLEQPLDAAMRTLQIGRESGATTILNPGSQCRGTISSRHRSVRRSLGLAEPCQP